MSLGSRLASWGRRIGSLGVLLRLGILGFGLLGLWLAVPELDHWGGYALLLIPGPVLAAVAAARPFAALTMLQAIVMLLIGGYVDGEVSPTVAVGVGVCCYLVHSCAAMAALWRVDTEADPLVWRGWLSRVGGVVAVSALAAGIVTVIVGQPIQAPPALLVTAAACLLLLVVAGVVWLYHRPEEPGRD